MARIDLGGNRTQYRLLHGGMVGNAMSKYWQDLAVTMGDQLDIERTADCIMRYGEELINKNAFKEIRAAIIHLNELMAERIEWLEEQNEQKSLRGIPHRNSA